MLVSISGPSGAGKSTLIRHLGAVYGAATLPSITTRPQRRDDEEGDYKFVDLLEYETLITSGAIMLDTTYGAHRYGTRRLDWDTALKSPELWVADLTAESVLEAYKKGSGPSVAVVLYVPISISTTRLAQRGNTEAELTLRVGAWAKELCDCVALGAAGCPLVVLDGTTELAQLGRRAVHLLRRVLASPDMDLTAKT